MLVLDTNVLLRYLLDDNEMMADIAEELLNSNEILIPFEVVAEIVYVLGNVYKMGRKQIAEVIKGLLMNYDVRSPNDALLSVALDCFILNNLDFVDCLMVGYQNASEYEVFTFDNKLKKILQSD